VPTQRWLITGASGQLGGHVVRLLAQESRPPVILPLAGRGAAGPAAAVDHIDLADADALRACVSDFRPTHVMHLGALTAVGDCFAQPERARLVNTVASEVLAHTAHHVGARLLFSSTDMVFDGAAAPYCEADPPHPLSHYARTKVSAEQALAAFPNALIVRIPLLYGMPCSRRETTFVQQLAALRNGQPLRLFTDEFRTPVWLADAARAIIGLARSDLSGLIQVAGPERLSRYDMIAACAALLGIAPPNLIRASRLDIAVGEPRPADLSLNGSRFDRLFPDLKPGPLRREALAVPASL
jgi:dTDP-4-dehydrorhamnose reductase